MSALLAPDPLWEATARPAPDAPPLEGETHADVVVIGGGFCGISCALHLAEAGCDTVLLEAEAIGFGASGRNGGQLIPCFKDNPEDLIVRHGPELGNAIADLGESGGDLVAGMIERHNIDCAFHRDGWILGVHAQAALTAVEERARQWQARGRDVRILGREEVAALTGCDKYVAGYLDPAGGGLNPMSLARGMAEVAQRLGARLHSRSPAERIERDGTGWRVTTPRGSVRCGRIVLATGAYSGNLIPALRRSMLTMQSMQIATGVLPEEVRASILPGGHVVSDTRRLLLYFRLNEEGRLVFGGRGSTGGEGIKPAHLSRLESTMRDYFPQIGTVPVRYHWAGQVDLTPERALRVHRPEPGIWAVIGFSGRGVAIAPAVGKALAEAVMRDSDEALPLAVTRMQPLPFHAARRPALAAAIGWAWLRDGLDHAGRGPSG
ncbi:NAD(P)/FAD-dependent oxidoreductase [Roseovarius sp. S4756]|uniref:NAD(P)/FAD-dependent oxidoreductase n=1 Tax=Roseovarius maritimus TaxID=3342637 RepID=UPI00372ACC55